MNAPSTMELCRDTEARPVECDTCTRDFPADQATEVRRRNETTGKWFYSTECQDCLKLEAEEKAEDLLAVREVKPDIEALLHKCEGMSRDCVFEALQAISLRLVAA